MNPRLCLKKRSKDASIITVNHLLSASSFLAGQKRTGCLFLCLLLSSTHAVGQVALYRTSPIDLHRQLREAFAAGKDVAAVVKTIIRETGDHSFDTLLRPSSSVRRVLHLQSTAWQAWSGGNLTQAIRLYRRAARALADSGSSSEMAFCFYYIAEIFSEQENFPESLLWLNRAIEVASSRNRPYLQALLFQSRGYSLWYMDHFQASIHNFTLALEHWHEIGFHEGIITSWNNLASLYEELRLWKRADYCYKHALEKVDESLDAEIRFYLHLNYAGFSHKRNQPSQARDHLKKARVLKEVSPGKFLLLEARIRGAESQLEQLLSFQPQLPSLRIERALLLGQFFRHSGKLLQARRYFEEALVESEKSGLRYFVRTSALLLGEGLEQEGQYQQAAELYFATLKREYTLLIPEVVFPYWRAISPLFDGWIRSLIRMGHTENAWRQIQRLVQLRKNKAQQILETNLPLEIDRDEVGQFILAGKLETQKPLPNPWDDAGRGDLREYSIGEVFFPLGKHRFTIVEMWPDGQTVYAWVIRPSGYVFQELAFPGGVAESIQEIVDPLYSARDLLPPPPTSRQLQSLYAHLIEPLEELLDSKNILFIGHKELESLPLEMLQNRQKEYLIEHYTFSYLPAVQWNLKQQLPNPSSPTLIAPRSFPDLPEMEREEKFFKTVFPDLQVLRELEPPLITAAHWVHISTHFRLDDRFWLVSGFGNDSQELNIFRFLQSPLSCTLLSLGACDLGNAYLSGSPYWLGFSELFLTRGVGSLLVSRWRLDDIASRIYRDFFALVREGLPMDEATARAKQNFMGQHFRRGPAKISGRHPFFWAGVTYVGLPGEALYPKPQVAAGMLLWGISLGLLVFSALLLLCSTLLREKRHLQNLSPPLL